jgi:hypothetical protein
MKISQRKILEVNDLMSCVMTDGRSRFTSENLGLGSSGVYECYAQKTPKGKSPKQRVRFSRHSDIRLFGGFGSLETQYFKLDIKTRAILEPEWTRVIDLFDMMDLCHKKLTCLFPQFEPKICCSGLLHRVHGHFLCIEKAW